MKRKLQIALNYMRLLKFYFKKNIKYEKKQNFYYDTRLEISKSSKKVYLGNNICTNKNCRIAVRDNAELFIGNNCTFNVGCQIISREKVVIGKNTHFGCNCIIIDNDHNFSKKNGYSTGFTSSPIIIGENCLIGANTVILKGVEIGDRSIIAAGSVITKNIPKESVIIQKRELN